MGGLGTGAAAAAGAGLPGAGVGMQGMSEQEQMMVKAVGPPEQSPEKLPSMKDFVRP
jgi:hypothetical protein